MLPRGIEPRSPALQTGAMTTSAKAAMFGGGMVESNSNRFRSPSVFKTVQVPDLITLHYSYHIETHYIQSKGTLWNATHTYRPATMCFYMAPEIRIELILRDSKSPVLPLHHSGIT